MKKSLVSKVLAAASLAFALTAASCASTDLYDWHGYQQSYYQYVKNADKESLDDLIKTYEEIIAEQDEIRGTVPPGIYADYGFLLLEKGKTEEAKAMLAKEIELYPESAVFVGSILKRLEK